MPHDLEAMASEIVEKTRQQNWKNGGALVMDIDECEQLILSALQRVREETREEALAPVREAVSILNDGPDESDIAHAWGMIVAAIRDLSPIPSPSGSRCGINDTTSG